MEVLTASQETDHHLPKPAEVALGACRFVLEQLRGGAWGDLGERYGTGDKIKHQPTIT